MKLQLTSASFAATLGLSAAKRGSATNHLATKNVASSYHHRGKNRLPGQDIAVGNVGVECDPSALQDNIIKPSTTKPDMGILGASCGTSDRLSCVADPSSSLGGRCRPRRRQDSADSSDRIASSAAATASRALSTLPWKKYISTPEEKDCAYVAKQCVSAPLSGYCVGGIGCGRCVVFCNAAACCDAASTPEEKRECTLGEPYKCGSYNLRCTGEDEPFPKCYLRQCCYGKTGFDEKKECVNVLYSPGSQECDTLEDDGALVTLPLFPEADECKAGPNAISTTCGTGQFCLVGLGVCSNESGEHWGTCYDKPNSCALEHGPVCGCDGITHVNACKAFAKGANIHRKGSCENPLEFISSSKEEKEDVPCLTKEDCDDQRQDMGLESFFFGEFLIPTKGCFMKNGKAFFSAGSESEMSKTDLPGMQERILCKEKPACLTQDQCDVKRQERGIESFTPGDFPSKGCFSKLDKAFFSLGTEEEMSKPALSGIQKRIWCDDTDVASSNIDGVPTALPTDVSSVSSKPTALPTAAPITAFPTDMPTVSSEPTALPTGVPSMSRKPIALPTDVPNTAFPTQVPNTASPTSAPSVSRKPSPPVADILDNISTSAVETPTSLPSSKAPALTVQPHTHSFKPHTHTGENLSSGPSQVPSPEPSVSSEPTTSPTGIPSMSSEPNQVPSPGPSASSEPTSSRTVSPTMSREPTKLPTGSPNLSQKPSESTRPSFPAAPVADVLDNISTSAVETPTSLPSSKAPALTVQPHTHSFKPHIHTGENYEAYAIPAPSLNPTHTNAPTTTKEPTDNPTEIPSLTNSSTAQPLEKLTNNQTDSPSPNPTKTPSAQPTKDPTNNQTDSLSKAIADNEKAMQPSSAAGVMNANLGITFVVAIVVAPWMF